VADEADLAQQHMETEAAMRARERKKPVLPPATGQCLYCGESVAPAIHFCSTDCRQDWGREQEIKKRQGLA
jgi:predicted nucleic acid-binding Zn ribbon protein